MLHLIQKHRSELARALSNFRYERMADGSILVPGMRAQFNGSFRTRIFRDGEWGPEQIDANLFLDGGLDDILKVYFAQQAQRTGFFIVPFTNDVDPAADLTAATFNSVMGEFTNYSESVRPTWAKDAESAQSISNATTPAVFTAAAGGGTVRGAALTTTSTKSSTAGLMPACSRFSADRVLTGPPDKLSVEYAIAAMDGSS